MITQLSSIKNQVSNLFTSPVQNVKLAGVEYQHHLDDSIEHQQDASGYKVGQTHGVTGSYIYSDCKLDIKIDFK
jgi:hypothetical protein